jgi:hypothetical protein
VSQDLSQNMSQRHDLAELNRNFRAGTDPGTALVTDPVMVLWRDGVMTTAHTDHRTTGASDVVQLGLFASLEAEVRPFVAPRHRAFAALLARAADAEDAALEVLTQLEPELDVLAGRLLRLGVEPAVARCDTLSVAWEVVAGHRLGPLLPTKGCLASAIWIELRVELGLRRHRSMVVVPLIEEMDVAVHDPDPPESRMGLLLAAVAAEVISEDQAFVITETRLDGRALAEVALELGRPYQAVRKDRRRAELALVAFARRYSAEELR